MIVLCPDHEIYAKPCKAARSKLEAEKVTIELIKLPLLPATADSEDEEKDVDKTASDDAEPAEDRTTSSDDPSNGPKAERLKEIEARLTSASPRTILTMGSRATEWALRQTKDVPITFCMVPNLRDTQFYQDDSPDRKRITGVTTDINPDTQVKWIKKLCPDIRRLGVPCSKRSTRTAKALQESARGKGVEIIPIQSKIDAFSETLDQLNRKGCDGALMLADAAVYNAGNAKGLLVWGLRQRKAIWAFSNNIVKAGACAGLYADVSGCGEQSAEIVLRLLKGDSPEEIGMQYPDEKHIRSTMNQRSARMIGIRIAPGLLSSLDHVHGEPR